MRSTGHVSFTTQKTIGGSKQLKTSSHRTYIVQVTILIVFHNTCEGYHTKNIYFAFM